MAGKIVIGSSRKEKINEAASWSNAYGDSTAIAILNDLASYLAAIAIGLPPKKRGLRAWIGLNYNEGPFLGRFAPSLPASNASSVGMQLEFRLPVLPNLLTIAVVAWLGTQGVAQADASVTGFIRTHCYECHSGTSVEAGLDLEKLSRDPMAPQSFNVWSKVDDRVRAGEMPPNDSKSISPREREAFLQSTHRWLTETQQAEYRAMGRVRGRRLTNFQLERTLHDLLGIDIPLATEMPDEPSGAEFTTYSDSQSMSHFHLEQHLKVIDLALDEAFRRATVGEDRWDRHFTAKEISRTQTRCREPEYIDRQAVIWSSRLIFYGRMPATTARESGWYRVRFRVSALKKPKDHGVWCTVRTGPCVSSAPLLGWVGAFEATDVPKEVTFDAWLPKDHMLEIRPADRTLKDAKFAGGQASNGEGGRQNVPGIAIDWLHLERIHTGPDQAALRKALIGDLDVKLEKKAQQRLTAQLVSEKPRQDLRRLMEQFAAKAFRRPIQAGDVDDYVELAWQTLKSGEDLMTALRVGYRAILCSPRFLYFYEEPGPLDDYAVASRLSYLLWSSMPDDVLLRLASKSRLREPAILEEQVDRMLAARRGQEFVKNFSAQWLELSQIDFTEPDGKIYSDFDIVVQNSMLDETHRFLQRLLDENLSVIHFVDSDFTFLNSRLARYYCIDGVDEDSMQMVRLKPEDRRGGLLTHGAVLKVTANGTNTSPVLRGVWVSNRILGVPIPPPPESVPAIEPDIRGAKTIRDQLEKHRSDDSCAACHAKIDPPGFALENFDAAGRWRDRYLQLENGKLRPGTAVDPSYTLKDGRSFSSLADFKKLVASQPEPLARNLAAKWIAYGTGGPIGFADRSEIKRIVDGAKRDEYGMRTLLKEVVKSPLFLSK